jgi:hypothetical protein
MALMNTTRSMYGAPAASAPTNSIYGVGGRAAAPANSMYGGGGAQPAYPGAQNSVATMLAQKYPWMAPNLPTAVQGHPTGGVLQALPIQGAPVNPNQGFLGGTQGAVISGAPVNPIYTTPGQIAIGGGLGSQPYNAGGPGVVAGVPGNYGPVSYGGNPYAEGIVNQPAVQGSGNYGYNTITGLARPGPVTQIPAGINSITGQPRSATPINQPYVANPSSGLYGGSGYTAAAPVTGRAVSGYAPNITRAGDRVLAGTGGMSGVSNGGYSPNITRAGDRVMSGYGSSGYGSGGGSRGYGGNGFSGGGGGFIM